MNFVAAGALNGVLSFVMSKRGLNLMCVIALGIIALVEVMHKMDKPVGFTLMAITFIFLMTGVIMYPPSGGSSGRGYLQSLTRAPEPQSSPYPTS